MSQGMSTQKMMLGIAESEGFRRCANFDQCRVVTWPTELSPAGLCHECSGRFEKNPDPSADERHYEAVRDE